MFRIFLLVSVFFAGLAQAEPKLVMFEQVGCHWCERWDEEIGPIYPKTAEGRAAPLQKLDIHASLPDGMSLKRSTVFTPTFVLIDEGKEVGRLEGYMGDEFFWVLLGDLLKQAGIKHAPSG